MTLDDTPKSANQRFGEMKEAALEAERELAAERALEADERAEPPHDYLTEAIASQLRDLNLTIVNLRAELAQTIAEREQWRQIAITGGEAP